MLEDEIYSYKTLADWLTENVPAGQVLSISKGVTVEMLVALLVELADDEWSRGIDAMGEDA